MSKPYVAYGTKRYRDRDIERSSDYNFSFYLKFQSGLIISCAPQKINNSLRPELN